MATKKNFIPVNEAERELILDIQKKVCDSEFMAKLRYNLIPETFDIYTVVLAFMNGIHSVFGKPEYEDISIGDIFVFIKTVRNKQTEKSGNINCKIVLGDVGKDIVDHGIEGFRDVLEEYVNMRSDMLAASVLAIKALKDYSTGGLKPEDVYHIASAFFVYMLIKVAECANNENVDPNTFGINIGPNNMSYFKIGFVRKNGKPVITINVGPELKKAVKSDALTE